MKRKTPYLAVVFGLVLASTSGLVGIVAAVDSDGDGLQDAWENTYNAPPGCRLNMGAADSSVPPNGINDGLEDYDADTLTNLMEQTLGTAPCNADSDSDGLDDGWEAACAQFTSDFSPTSADGDADGVLDIDEDTDMDDFQAAAEYAAGTSCVNADSDYDGVPDGADASPMANPTVGTNDVDGDGLPDIGFEATYGLLPGSPLGPDGAQGDPDQDAFVNLVEYLDGTNPMSKDTDNDADSLNDAWENAHFCLNPAVFEGGANNFDADAWTNFQESLLGTDPCNADADGDGDGMPNNYESTIAPGVGVNGAGNDDDGDGNANGWEWQNTRDPVKYDFDEDIDSLSKLWEDTYATSNAIDNRGNDGDADGIIDWDENLHGYDPTSADADTDVDGLPDAWEVKYTGGIAMNPGADPDGDGFTNLQEFLHCSQPNSPDADGDGDGMPDFWEAKYGFDITVNDAGNDWDQDTVSNFAEFVAYTNPRDIFN